MPIPILPKAIFAAVVMASLALPLQVEAQADAAPRSSRPNVLFISVDDLNDWIGFLGGHPNAATPHLDRLATRGTSFANAYCQAPACGPSRASLLTGVRPHRSGVYVNNSVFRESPVLADTLTLPQRFRQHGYYASGAGKIYHTLFPDPESWDAFWPSKEVQRPLPEPLPGGQPLNGLGMGHFDWGPISTPIENISDRQVVRHVAKSLSQKQDQPFFLACGIYLPHMPWHLPQDYLDRFPLDQIQLPTRFAQDLDDLPVAAHGNRRIADHQAVTEAGQWKQAVQAYLAAIAFADDCLGILLEALDNGPHRDNTLVVLWSDHGWHLGEKETWRKFTLWERATRVPLIFAGPGIPKGELSHATVELLDIYPTLLDLAGLPSDPNLDGISLRPYFETPDRPSIRPALTTWGRGNHSVRSDRWRYIRYQDGSEELYDHQNDPNEWTNLASRPDLKPIRDSLARWMPVEEALPVPGVQEQSFYEREEALRRKLQTR